MSKHDAGRVQGSSIFYTTDTDCEQDTISILVETLVPNDVTPFVGDKIISSRGWLFNIVSINDTSVNIECVTMLKGSSIYFCDCDASGLTISLDALIPDYLAPAIGDTVLDNKYSIYTITDISDTSVILQSYVDLIFTTDAEIEELFAEDVIYATDNDILDLFK